jgi:hypothetical protein
VVKVLDLWAEHHGFDTHHEPSRLWPLLYACHFTLFVSSFEWDVKPRLLSNFWSYFSDEDDVVVEGEDDDEDEEDEGTYKF